MVTWTVAARKRAEGTRPVLGALRSSGGLPRPHLVSELGRTRRRPRVAMRPSLGQSLGLD